MKAVTQEELANRMNCTQQMISKLEKQEWIDSEVLKKILFELKTDNKEWEAVKRLPTGANLN
jgi:transcriptional regulator with XRE-family HTH domain